MIFNLPRLHTSSDDASWSVQHVIDTKVITCVGLEFYFYIFNTIWVYMMRIS